MATLRLYEIEVETAALTILEGLDWQTAHGPDNAPYTPGAELKGFGQMVLESRLQDALARLNPFLPTAALDDAIHKLTRPEGAALETRDRAFCRLAVNGINVEYRSRSGSVQGDQPRSLTLTTCRTTTGWWPTKLKPR